MAFFSFTSNTGSAELDPIVADLGITGFFRKKDDGFRDAPRASPIPIWRAQKIEADESSATAQKSHSWSIFLPNPLTSIAPVGIKTASPFRL
ncbi:MAG TPA: hypothetical protein VJS85_06625, partial [Rhizomicrobium sp.]|nr:hypothetical protein [Rhizomicrobium sp.]